MFSNLVVLGLGLSVLSIDEVLSSFICKDSTLDSIAYANDAKMYFIASGGHYWWIKDTGFPPKDSVGKPIPEPFKKTTAALYIDGDNGCKEKINTRVKGMKAKEKEVWVTEIVGGKQKLMALDTKYGKWGDAIDYDEDHCISKARIDFNKPIDAMFSRNYLEIYLVQGDTYAMVDCTFICTDPENKFGDDKPESKTQDFGTKDPIFGMLVIGVNENEKLLMFQKKVYYVMEIKTKQSTNGKVIANKVGTGKDILIDFLRLKKETECTGLETPPPLVEETSKSDDTEPEAPDKSGEAEAAEGETSSGSPTPTSEGTGSGLWIIITIIVVVLIVVAVALCLCFAFRAKKVEESEASKPDAEKGVATTSSKTGSKTGSKMGVSSKTGSKVGGPPVSPNKASASSNVGSTMSTRSGIAKSANPKSTATKK